MTVTVNSSVSGGGGSSDAISIASSDLITAAAGGTLTPGATYIGTDVVEEFIALSESTFKPKVERVQCTLEAFGGTWTGTADDTAAIAAAATYAATFTPRRHIELPRRVGVSGSIYIPRDVFVYGAGWEPTKALNTQVKVLSGASFSTGFVFNLNTTNGTSAAESQNAWDVGPINGIFGVFLDNTPNNVAGARLCTFAGSFAAQDISGFRSTQLVKQVPGVYSDKVRIDRVIVLSSLAGDNSEFQIDLGGTVGGDSHHVSNLIFGPGENNGEPEKAVKLAYSNAGKITSLINGQISLVGCSVVEISSWHTEAAKLTADRASFTLRDSNMDMKSGGYYPIDLTTAYGSATQTVVLENVEFRYGMVDREGNVPAEVRLTKNYVLTVRNCKRTVGSANNPCGVGIRVHNNSSAAIAAWNNNAGYLSVDGKIANLVPYGSYDCQMSSASLPGVTGAPTLVTGYGSSTFVGGNTYYYKAQLLIDVPKLVGWDQSTAEAAKAVAADTPTAQTQRISAGLTSFSASGPALGTWRFYRGTSPGVYDVYCDVPSVWCQTMQDQGDYVNGCPWIARTPGAVDTLSQPLGSFKITPTDGARMTSIYEGAANLQGTADATIGTPAAIATTAVIVSTLTADHDYTIHAGVTAIGSRIRLVRIVGGAFNANLKNPAGSLLKALAATGTWCEAELCYGNVWRLTGAGSL